MCSGIGWTDEFQTLPGGKGQRSRQRASEEEKRKWPEQRQACTCNRGEDMQRDLTYHSHLLEAFLPLIPFGIKMENKVFFKKAMWGRIPGCRGDWSFPDTTSNSTSGCCVCGLCQTNEYVWCGSVTPKWGEKLGWLVDLYSRTVGEFCGTPRNLASPQMTRCLRELHVHTLTNHRVLAGGIGGRGLSLCSPGVFPCQFKPFPHVAAGLGTKPMQIMTLPCQSPLLLTPRRPRVRTTRHPSCPDPQTQRGQNILWSSP